MDVNLPMQPNNVIIMNKEHKYYFPVHLDGGNRGCEGIAKGTSAILGEPKENLIGLCRDIPLDNRLGIGDKVSLQSYRNFSLWFRFVNKVYVNALKVFRRDSFEKGILSRHYTYKPFVNQMQTGDVMLSTGGDMMCYDDNFVISTTEWAKKRGAKTVLWGCSMGEKNLSPRKRKVLTKFDLIYARESLSFDFFKSLDLKNVVCYPDPAFVLEPKETQLPEAFDKGKVIGINLSNFTIGGFTLDTPFGNEVRNLLNYILDKTEYEILLVPHVTWSGQDDRILAQNVVKEYSEKAQGRISILPIDGLNYLQIRYIISKCNLFIGGRTHAVISAYSTCVPTIALGYSIKSRGIAKDLGLDDILVVNSKSHADVNELMDSFMFLLSNEENIRNHLKNVMRDYKKKTFSVKKDIDLLIM